MVKIAICGKMASGKTTLAEELAVNDGFKILSLAGEVKRVGIELFNMKEKDRPLLQQIGMKMREIRESVWLDVLIKLSEEHELVVCDDVRFINEAETLKKHGWVLIKLDISEDLQKERLKNTYKNNWEIHWNNRTDPSEAEVDKIPLEWFDEIIVASNDDSALHRVRPRVKCNE